MVKNKNMKVNINTDLIINNNFYQPIEIKKDGRNTNYLYYIEKWSVMITQEDTDELVSMLMIKKETTIDKILKDNLGSPYEIAFAIYMNEIEENFNRLKDDMVDFIIKNLWI
jgi:hypothetical protein